MQSEGAKMILMNSATSTSHSKGCRSHRELRRVREHIARAEGRALAAPSPISPLRRVVRALLLDEVARYRRRGVFPRNPGPHALRPVFVDAVGTRCAMAHLLEFGGEDALVARIARERNFAYVNELADEPRLRAWLTAAGLTLAEAAAIQPGYTLTDLVSCVCGRRMSNFHGQLFHDPPSPAVLDVRVVEVIGRSRDLWFNEFFDAAGVRGEVTSVHGASARYAVGQVVGVVTNPMEPSPAVGDRVLVPVESAGAVTAPNDAGLTMHGGYHVRGNLTVGCSSFREQLLVGPFLEAVRSMDCAAIVMRSGVLDAGFPRDAPAGTTDVTTDALDAGQPTQDITIVDVRVHEETTAPRDRAPPIEAAARVDAPVATDSPPTLDTRAPSVTMGTPRGGCSAAPTLEGEAPSTVGILVALLAVRAMNRRHEPKATR